MRRKLGTKGQHTSLVLLDCLLNTVKLKDHDIYAKVARKLGLFKVNKILPPRKNLLDIDERILKSYYRQISNLICSSH